MKKIQLHNFLPSFGFLIFGLLISSPLAFGMEMQCELQNDVQNEQQENKLENKIEKDGLEKKLGKKLEKNQLGKNKFGKNKFDGVESYEDESSASECFDHLPKNFRIMVVDKDGNNYFIRCTPTLTNSNHYIHPKA